MGLAVDSSRPGWLGYPGHCPVSSSTLTRVSILWNIFCSLSDVPRLAALRSLGCGIEMQIELVLLGWESGGGCGDDDLSLYFKLAFLVILRHCPRRFGEKFSNTKTEGLGLMPWMGVVPTPYPLPLHCLVTVAGLPGEPGCVTSWLWQFTPP